MKVSNLEGNKEENIEVIQLEKYTAIASTNRSEISGTT
jgi:hypothetical protein